MIEWHNSITTVQDKSGQWLIKLQDEPSFDSTHIPQPGDKCVLWDCFSAKERMRGTFEECQAFAERHTAKPTKMQGVPVSEGDVATGLGFKDVYEFRQWQTEVGRENAELKHALRNAKDEALRFRWHGMRGSAILERCKTFLEGVKSAIEAEDSRQLKESVGWYGDTDKDPKHLKKLLLAIGVINGGQGVVDWDHELDDWLEYLNPIRIKIDGENCIVSGILDGDSRTRRTLETDLATFTGPKLTVTADHVGLVSGGIQAWLDNVPKTCRITYKMSQLGMCVYYTSDNPYETADYDDAEAWGLEPAPEPAAYSCLVKPAK